MTMARILVVGALALSGCTTRNAAFCGDGLCSDPARPYCDLDGSFGGENPPTCVAVACEPMTFAQCRGDVAITCSPLGNNYDETECPLGCDPAAGGCRACTTNTQCDTATPFCDPGSSQCRQCRVDDECDSRVCDQGSGTCVAETSVVYASPDGTGTCSLTQPCALANAVTLATNATVTPILRMLPGTYTSSLDVRNVTAKPLEVVATQANIVVIGNLAAVVVKDGASVHIRGLATTSERVIQCGAANAPLSALSVEDAVLGVVGDSTLMEVTRCNLRLSVVDLAVGSSSTPLGTGDDATFEADRLRILGDAAGSTIVLAGSRVNFHVTNSLLENVDFISFTSDTGPPGTHVSFAFDTLVYTGRPLRLCGGGTVGNRTVRFENTILAPTGAFDAVASPNPQNCSFVSTLLARQVSAPQGAIVMDPQFTDPAMRDFHLEPSSPAIDLASPGTVTVDHDLDGAARPQGPKSDLGAYEHAP